MTVTSSRARPGVHVCSEGAVCEVPPTHALASPVSHIRVALCRRPVKSAMETSVVPVDEASGPARRVGSSRRRPATAGRAEGIGGDGAK